MIGCCSSIPFSGVARWRPAHQSPEWTQHQFQISWLGYRVYQRSTSAEQERRAHSLQALPGGLEMPRARLHSVGQTATASTRTPRLATDMQGPFFDRHGARALFCHGDVGGSARCADPRAPWRPLSSSTALSQLSSACVGTG